MSNPVFPPIAAEGAIPASSNVDEAAFLLSWDNDVKAAARASAIGFAEQEDLAQAIRMRLLIVHRRFPDVPRAYLRAVISNMLRSIHRHDAQKFTARSPLAQPITEDLGALVGHPIETA